MLWRFIWKFSTFLENYPPKFEIIEILGSVNFFHSKIYDFLIVNFFDLLTVFWNFLANYPAKSDIISLIVWTGC